MCFFKTAHSLQKNRQENVLSGRALQLFIASYSRSIEIMFYLMNISWWPSLLFAYLKLLETVYIKRHCIFFKKNTPKYVIKRSNLKYFTCRLTQPAPYTVPSVLCTLLFKKKSATILKEIHKKTLNKKKPPRIMIRGIVSSTKYNCATIK